MFDPLRTRTIRWSTKRIVAANHASWFNGSCTPSDNEMLKRQSNAFNLSRVIKEIRAANSMEADYSNL